MKVVTKQLELETRGAGDLIDITVKVQRALESAGLKSGSVTVFVVGSTAGITTFEYESGLITDMQELYNSIAPQDRHYAHDETWGDANGFSHLR
ncbi:MAG: YjbQ family protein, partial [Candidatus Omnitrophota bacterium]